MFFLRDLQVRRFVFKTEYFKNVNTDFASDFDVYTALCESITFFVGNQIRDSFLRVLSDESSEDVTPLALCNSEYRKNLWKRVFYDESSKALNMEKKALNPCFLKEQSLISQESIDISGLVRIDFENIFDALEDALLTLSAKKVGMISFDMRGMKYTRPNDFLAQKSYEQFKLGATDGTAFFLWLLCRILMKTKFTLRIIVDDTEAAESIIELLSVLKLDTEIYISFSDCLTDEYEKYARLLLQNYKKNISLELYISKEMERDAILERFENIIKIIPLVCIKIPCEAADIVCSLIDNLLEGKVESAEKNIIINALRRAE